jgi:hypothetical protein
MMQATPPNPAKRAKQEQPPPLSVPTPDLPAGMPQMANWMASAGMKIGKAWIDEIFILAFSMAYTISAEISPLAHPEAQK